MQRTKEILKHIPELDGVRGIAVLSVMMIHFYAPVQSSMPFGTWDSILRHGGSGVNVFFVLSGFLITSILVSTKSADNYPQAFYARRALRIFPLYIVFLVLFSGLHFPSYTSSVKTLSLTSASKFITGVFFPTGVLPCTSITARRLVTFGPSPSKSSSMLCGRL